MKQSTHIFFDLDHTLWDYDFNAKKVLKEMYDQFDLSSRTTASLDGFFKLFFKINAALWYQFNMQLIDRDDIRDQRFSRILKQCGNTDDQLASQLSDFFIYHCPRQKKIMEGADVLLAYLQPRYELHVITNGFDDVQRIKMEYSGLDRYIQKVVTSESIGYRKPSAEIFEYALAETKATPELSIMIGDNHLTDITGARNAGIQPVLFDPTGTVKSDCEIQVTGFWQLMKLL